MKSTVASAVAILAMACTVSASALSLRNDAVPKPSRGTVYECSASEWEAGKCVNKTYCFGKCYVLDPEFNGHMGSVGPDQHTWCRVYSDSTCGHSIWSGGYPGCDNLYWDNGADLGHQAHSIMCMGQPF